MSRIIMIKVSDIHKCRECRRTIHVDQWAQALGNDGYVCQPCVEKSTK